LAVPLLTRTVDCDHQGIPPNSRQRKQLVKSRHIKVATWNVRTLMDADNSSRPRRRTALIASKLSRYNIDIAALRETSLADEGSLNEMASGYTFFWKGLPANSRCQVCHSHQTSSDSTQISGSNLRTSDDSENSPRKTSICHSSARMLQH